MADNTVLPAGAGGDTVRDVDRAGVKTQVTGLDVNIGGGTEQLMTSAALADAAANPTLPSWAVFGMLWNGTTWDRMRGTVANGLAVDVTRVQAQVNTVIQGLDQSATTQNVTVVRESGRNALATSDVTGNELLRHIIMLLADVNRNLMVLAAATGQSPADSWATADPEMRYS